MSTPGSKKIMALQQYSMLGKDILDIVDECSKGNKEECKQMIMAALAKYKPMGAVFIHEVSKAKDRIKQLIEKLKKKKVGGGQKFKRIFTKLLSWLRDKVKLTPKTIFKFVLELLDKLIDAAAVAGLPYANEVKMGKDFLKNISKGNVSIPKPMIELAMKQLGKKDDREGMLMETKGQGVSLPGGGVSLPGGGLKLAGGAKHVSRFSGGGQPCATGSYYGGQMGEGIDSRLARLKKRLARARSEKSKVRIKKTIAKLEKDYDKIKRREARIAKFLLKTGEIAAPIAGEMLGGPLGAAAATLGYQGLKKFVKGRGTKEEVYKGYAKKTGGGLTKDDLMVNSKGKIVSKKMHARGKAQALKYGYKKKSK